MPLAIASKSLLSLGRFFSETVAAVSKEDSAPVSSICCCKVAKHSHHSLHTGAMQQKKPEGGKGCQVVLIYKILQKAGRWSHPIIFRGLIYPDFAASCSSGISWCITYPAPLHTSKDPSPCTPSSSELLPMPPFSAWFSVCPDMPQLVRSTSFQKATDLVFEKQCLDSLSARPTWHSSKANFAFSACSVKSSPRQRATGTMIFPPSPPQLVDKSVLHCDWLASDFKDE